MIKRYLIRIISITSLLLFIGAGVGLVVFQRSGGEVLSVQSGSMEPVLKTGAVVTVSRVPVEQIAKGDIVTFINPANKNQTITHRVVQIAPSMMSGGKPYLVTKGDANVSNDAPIPASTVVGKVKYHVPYLGYAVDFMRKPLGLLLIIYIPALLLITGEMKRLIAYYRRIKPYSLYGNKRPSGSYTPLVAVVVSVAVIASAGMAGTAFAAISSTATLTGNTISTGPIDEEPEEPPDNTVTCSNNTSVNVNSSTNQSATSGNASNNNNTNGGSATSGNASNSSSTNVDVSINNTCPAPAP